MAKKPPNNTGKTINRRIKPGHHVLRNRNDGERTAFCTECNQIIKTWKQGDRFRCSVGKRSQGDVFRDNNPGYDRNYWLVKTYNITLVEYNSLLERQNGVCAICKLPEKDNRINLAVDHDHSCCSGTKNSCGNCIRGLLCWGCNTTLGRLEPCLSAFVDYLNQ